MMVDGRQLYLMSRDIDLPVQLEVAATGIHTGAGSLLQCNELLRLLPERRMVCRADFQGQIVLAKLFLHPDKAERDYEQELSGYQFFIDAKIQTPKLISSGTLNNSGFYILFEFIDSAVSLESQIQSIPDKHSLACIENLMPVVAKMHNCNFQQIDLHLNNFLLLNQDLYTIDCGDVSSLSQSTKQSLSQIEKNLADILSQLPIIYDQFIMDFLDLYHRESKRKQTFSRQGICQQVKRWRQWRIARYLKKASRNCSEFIRQQSFREMRVCRRDHSSEVWLDLYSRLDELVENSVRLKDGNTATVALAECAGQKIVIKRYNIKHWRHWLGRFWRPSRAWKTWQNAHHLKVLGIKTPQPLAVIEQRFGWLRSKAFYVSQYEPAEDALSKYSGELAVAAQHQDDFSYLFAAMINAGISHGDLKANNILLTKNGLSFIDLDAMRFHRRTGSFNTAFARDKKRFLRNWSKNSDTYKLFSQLLDNLPKKPVC